MAWSLDDQHSVKLHNTTPTPCCWSEWQHLCFHTPRNVHLVKLAVGFRCTSTTMWRSSVQRALLLAVSLISHRYNVQQPLWLILRWKYWTAVLFVSINLRSCWTQFTARTSHWVSVSFHDGSIVQQIFLVNSECCLVTSLSVIDERVKDEGVYNLF